MRAGDRFCGLCFTKLTVTEEAPAAEPQPAAAPFNPLEAWAPSGATPVFHKPQPREPEPLAYGDNPAGVTAALADWKRSISWTERWRIRKPRPAEELRAASACFASGEVPPQLAAWFAWWDGQSDNGCWIPGQAVRALPLSEALDRRKMLLGLGEDWSALSRFQDWLPLLESAGGDVVLFAQLERGCGLAWIEHENPLGSLEAWGRDAEALEPLPEAIADAALRWRTR